MARLFISYASADRPFVLRLSENLRQAGHTVWVDVHGIRVGQGIPQQVARAVELSDYLILVLSKQSMASSWSEHEWYAKYWQEVTTRRQIILPALLEDCTIPFFLRPKCYADFRTSYEHGLSQLERSLADAALCDPFSLCYPEDTMHHAGQLISVDVELSLPYIGKVAGTWRPDEREQNAAWEMYVEMVTRISVADPITDEGSLREDLSSLYTLFTTTRAILRSYGPAIARPKDGSKLSFGYLAINVLNYVLRPVLTKWHPLLSDYEHRRPTDVSPLQHEADWEHAQELREALDRVRAILIDYSNLLAEISRVPGTLVL